MKKTVSDEKRFIAIATVILVVISIVALFPMILLVVASFTDENELITNGYQILPKKLSLEAYTYMVKQAAPIVRAYLVTIGTTVVGTGLSVLLTTSIAYPMARKTFKYRNALSFFVYFTMLFNGGLVPQYIMWTTFFHIKDTYAALIFPNLLMTAFNIFLVRNYYSNSLPEALSSIVTIVLSFGTQKMAKEHAIIRKLQAVEGLGSVSVICSDKTGTLTQNKMTVEDYYVNDTLIPNKTAQKIKIKIESFCPN